MPKKIFIILIIFLIAFGFLIFNFRKAKKIEAGTADNVWGWAWSENIGWISFNSTNTGAAIDYGVNINASTGQLAGHAWSSNIGWISFERSETATPPGPPFVTGNFIAKVDNVSSTICDTDNDGFLDTQCGGKDNSNTPISNYKQVFGWARALAACPSETGNDPTNPYDDPCQSTNENAGGWSGWIKLSKDPADVGAANYGTTIDMTTNPKEFRGWAWGGGGSSTSTAVVGWISFNTTNYPGGADYKVLTSLVINQPPEAKNLNQNIQYCNISPGVAKINLSWTYDDPENTDQQAYSLLVEQWDGASWQLKVRCENVSQSVADGGTGSSAVYINRDPPIASQICNSATYVGNLIEYGRQTRWSVKVKDSNNVWSDWATPSSFSIDSHAYPYPDFAPFPSHPAVGEVVTFEQDGPPPSGAPRALCYPGGVEDLCQNVGVTIYFWDFGNGQTSSFKGNATTTYTTVGDYTVTLTITDDVGSCSYSRPLTLTLPLPKWKEIKP